MAQSFTKGDKFWLTHLDTGLNLKPLKMININKSYVSVTLQFLILDKILMR